MKKIQKITTILIMIFLIIPVINIELGASTSLYLPGILAYEPESIDAGIIKPGDTKIVVFDIWNAGVNTNFLQDGRQYSRHYSDFCWEIQIPDDFLNRVTVTPNSGCCSPGIYNETTESVDFDKTKIMITIDTTGLPWGVYECELHIICDWASYLNGNVLPIKFSIGPSLFYSPDSDPGEIDISMTLGKPDHGVTTFEIWNSGCGSLEYNLSYTCYNIWYQAGLFQEYIKRRDVMPSNWIEITPLSGTSTGEHDVITVKINTSTLDEWTTENALLVGGSLLPMHKGVYECDIDIDSNAVNNNGKGRITIEVIVKPELEFGQNNTHRENFIYDDKIRGDCITEEFDIWNRVNGTLNWEIAVVDYFSDYISVSPMKGTSSGPDDKTTVTVTINTSKKLSDESRLNFLKTYHSRKVESDEYAAWLGYHKDVISIISNDPAPRYGEPWRWFGTYPSADGQVYVKNYNMLEFKWDCIPHVSFEYYLGLCSIDENYDMVIITTNFFKNNVISTYPLLDEWYNLDDLKEAHKNIDGFNVSIVSVEDIYKDYLYGPFLPKFEKTSFNGMQYTAPYFLASEEIRNALSIREFLRDAYFHWGKNNPEHSLKYVLLVGDDDWEMKEVEKDVLDHCVGPMWNYYYRNLDTVWVKLSNIKDGEGVGYYSKNFEVPTFQKYIGTVSEGVYSSATDVPYAYLGTKTNDAIDFKYDSGQCYLQSLYDLNADVYVGRAPVDTPKELSNFVRKTISYMKSPTTDEYKRAVITSEYLGVKSTGSSAHKVIEPHDVIGWKTISIPVSRYENDGILHVRIYPLYPYTYTIRVWNETTQKYDEITKLRNLKISSVNLYGTVDLGNGLKGEKLVDTVDLGNNDSEIEHNVWGWNTTGSYYEGESCRWINYKDNPFGGNLQLSSDEKITSIQIKFYNHPTPYFDTFIVYINGEEVGRYKDNPDESYSWENPPGGKGCSGREVYSWPWMIKTIDNYPELLDDEDEIVFNDTHPDIKIIKKVKNYNGKWVDYVAPNRGDTLEFSITIVNTGNIDLKNLMVYDYLQNVLEYNEDANPPALTDDHQNYSGYFHVYDDEGNIIDTIYIDNWWGSNRTKIVWKLLELKKGQHLSIKYSCKVLQECDVATTVFVTNDVCSDDDTVYLMLKLDGIPSNVFNITILKDWPLETYPIRRAVNRWNDDDMLDLINSGIGLINHMGHSDKNSRLYDNMRLDDGNVNYYTPKQMMNTVYPIIFSTGDYGGQFDAYSIQEPGEYDPLTGRYLGGYIRDSMAECLIGDKNGAVAGIWNAMAMPADEDAALAHDRYFWHQIFGEHVSILGKAFYISKCQAGSSCKELYYGLNLFGDPALKIKGVGNLHPVAVINSSYSGEPIPVNQTLKFDGSNSYDSDGEIVSYTWDFDDGTTSSEIATEHLFSKVGRHRVSLTVIDDDGATDTDYFYIHVVNPLNSPPVISMENPINGSTAVPVDIRELSVLIEDPEGDSFSWVISLKEPIEYRFGEEEVFNGTKTLILPESLEYNTTYTWYVTAVDSGSGYTSKFFYKFTTAPKYYSEENNPPIADAGGPYEATIGQPLILDGSNSYDPDGKIVDWIWSYSTGTSFPEYIGSGEMIENTWNNPGEYTITLTVTDNQGSSDIATTTLTVYENIQNNPPVISCETPVNNESNVSIYLDSLSVTIEDPEGDSFDWSIETSPDIGNSNVVNDFNGTKVCNVSGLKYNTTYTWFINATDTGSGFTTRSVFTFTTKSKGDSDEEDLLLVNITKPLQDSFYFKNKMMRSFFFTFIVGEIDIVADVTDWTGSNNNISGVKFLLDDEEKISFDYNPLNTTYVWFWDERVIGFHTVKVVVCNSENEILADDELDVFIINLNLK